MKPYEFEYDINEKNISVLDPHNQEQVEFIKKLAAILKEKDVEGLLSICKASGDYAESEGGMEITQDRVNLIIEHGDVCFCFIFYYVGLI